MNFQLPDLSISLNLVSKKKFERIRYIKTALIMVLAYWIDISETSKTYYKKVYDKDLEIARLMNLRKFANPRLINFLLPTRQDGRRLNEINDSLYGALEHGMIYESNHPYACPRILSIGHAFSHFDSTIGNTEGLGNPNKAHCLLDILIFHANKPFDEIEISILRVLIKSRIKLFLANDYRIESFDREVGNPINLLREMFLALIIIESFSELTGLSSQSNFLVHIKRFEEALKQRINSYSSLKDLRNYNFLDFINAFVSSIRINGGYRQLDLLNLRNMIDLLPKLNNNFCWIREIIKLINEDPFNVEYLESVVLPKFDLILTTKLEKYYANRDNLID